VSGGNVSRGSPDFYVVIQRQGEPFARVDVWWTGHAPFTEAKVWKEFVLVGCGDYASLIEPQARTVRHYPCDGYFGKFYPLSDRLLIATCGSLICLNASGEILWKNKNLAIDGVIVDRIHDDIIEGQGEWDPPGGWRPFRLSLQRGEEVT
jgi:hypothetical protein